MSLASLLPFLSVFVLALSLMMKYNQVNWLVLLKKDNTHEAGDLVSPSNVCRRTLCWKMGRLRVKPEEEDSLAFFFIFSKNQRRRCHHPSFGSKDKTKQGKHIHTRDTPYPIRLSNSIRRTTTNPLVLNETNREKQTLSLHDRF